MLPVIPAGRGQVSLLVRGVAGGRGAVSVGGGGGGGAMMELMAGEALMGM